MDEIRASVIRNVCVYCGSSEGTDPAFVTAAHALGREIVAAGARLVYGGGKGGLMGAVARSVLDHGGHVTGIIPDFLRDRELMLEEAQDLRVVPDMHARKRLMFDAADAFVALPGGVGTLEELVEQLTWVQLQRHRKPVLIADIAGFWRPLLALFEHMREKGFIRSDIEVSYLVAERVADIMPMLAAAASKAQREGQVSERLDANL
ncbi:MAG TPA: TIGR00730 family Rossman fold protein [Beijerinckiaceae bacterium]|nr:TIGR00730 family Rossman fold protein [Beijerinckiaceae bacterium]